MKPTKAYYAAWGMVLLLSACMSPEEKQRQQDQYEMSECLRLGFTPNTENFGQCRLQLRSIKAQNDLANATEHQASSDDSDALITAPEKCKVTHSGATLCKSWPFK